jgi:hypothetical protein
VDTRAFLLGLVTAVLLCAAGYHFYLKPVEPDPCRACSTGTRCAAGLCVAANIPAQPVVRKKGWQRPRTTTGGSTGAPVAGNMPGNAPPGVGAPDDPSPPVEPPPPPPPPPLKPEERKLVSVGDKLTGTEVINLAESGGAADRELSQEDIDAVVRPRQPTIVSCIDDARGEAQLSAIITVAFRIRRSGEVAGVRVEAPAYLISHGLNDCIRRLILPLRFPASGKAQVVTYPFSLH